MLVISIASGASSDRLVAAELAAENKGRPLADPCLQPGDRIGPCELSQHLAMALTGDLII